MPVVDPATGEVIGTSTDTTGSPADGTMLYANPTLVSDRPLDTQTFGWVAVVELLALVFLPGLLVASARRRRRHGAQA